MYRSQINIAEYKMQNAPMMSDFIVHVHCKIGGNWRLNSYNVPSHH